MSNTKQWLTLAQAAKRKKVTTRTVFNWVKHGVLQGAMRRPEQVPKIMHVEASALDAVVKVPQGKHRPQ